MNTEQCFALRGRLADLPPSAVLSSKEAAIYCRSSNSTWARLRAHGETPTAIRLNGKAVGFRKRDLDAWLDARTEQPGRAA